MEYKLKFTFNYLTVSNFKEHDFFILINHLTTGRFATKIKYLNPANISFENSDYKHEFPIVKTLDSFKRKITNCIEFELLNDHHNRGCYDRLFLYYTDCKTPSYGYVLYNTQTGRMGHKFLIYGDINDLFRCLNDSFHRMHADKLFDFYSRKYYSSKGQFGYNADTYPTEKELQPILDEMRNS